MGNFIAVDLSIQTNKKRSDILVPLFSDPFFRPVAIGAVAGKPNNWFLSGYALEPFISLYSRGETGSVTISTESQETHKYLQSIQSDLLASKNLSRIFSPFEIVNEEVGVSFFKDLILSTSTMEELDSWLKDFAIAEITIQACIQLAIATSKDLPWDRCFQMLFPWKQETKAVPFVTVRITHKPHYPNTIKVEILAQTMIWLHGQHILSGKIGLNEADQNLFNLASFAERIAKQNDIKLQEAILTLDGSKFHSEADRISAAFFEIYPLEINLV